MTEKTTEEQRKPQVTSSRESEPIPIGYRRAQFHCINTMKPFQLSPVGPSPLPLNSIAWGTIEITNCMSLCQHLPIRGTRKKQKK